MSSSSTSLDIRVTKKFRPFLEPHRYKVAYGGRGSGKSWAIAHLLVLQAYTQPTRILCAREIQKSIDTSVIQLLADTIRRMGLSRFFEVQRQQIIGNNGSLFLFSGLAQNVSKLKSMEGINRVWVEEAEQVSAASWETLIPTIRTPGSEIWVSFNPRRDDDDTYQRFVLAPPPDSYVVKVNFFDNPWFPEELEKERAYLQSVDKELYRHVYEGECLAHFQGAYYAKQIDLAREDGRIGSVPIEPMLPVHSFWDLGLSDATAIWLVQQAAGQLRVIAYYENHGEGLQHYINWLHEFRDKHSITYGDHYAPHDIKQREYTTGKTRKYRARQMGVVFRDAPFKDVQYGIDEGRMIINRCWFDEKRCREGLRALRYYRCEYVEDKGDFKPKPLHDWSSHGADAWRYFAVSWKDKSATMRPPTQFNQDWNVFQ